MAEEIKNPNAEEEYQPDLMTLEDEDGNEVTFEVSVGEDSEGEYLDVVEDDETLLEVSKLFEKRLSDQFEIE